MERYLIIKTRDELLRIKIGQILYFEQIEITPNYYYPTESNLHLQLI